MTNTLRKPLAFLLVLAMILSLAPFAFAEELQEPSDTAPTEENVLPGESSPETGLPSEESPPEEISPEASAEMLGAAPTPEDYGIMAAATSGNVYLFDLASPYNYTTVLSSQVTIKYKPNGSGSSVTAYLKNLGWHFAQYGGVAYSDDPIYCIEPNKNFAASTPGNYMDTDVAMDGSGGSRGENVWYAMPESYRRAITLTLIFSGQMWDSSYSVKSTAPANNPNVPLRLATQFLIYEIVTGLRDGDSFSRNDSNGYTSGDVLYNAGSNISGFTSNYNALVEKVQSAMKLPSFVSSSSGNAPTIALSGDLTTVTDYNGVLPYFSFPSGSGASFTQYGDTLYIEQVGDISPTKVFSCYRNVPSAESSSVALYYGGTSTYQTCVKLHRPSSSDLYGYFKLKGQPTTGSLSLTKTTEDGQNLQGWRFGIYSNSACTTLVSGPHTTNASGKLSVSGLSAGTYYVKELGHQDSTINGKYTCASTNPQKVTISGGSTASVSFHNKLNTGTLKLVKQTNTGNDLGGWKIGVYTDSACTKAVAGSPFTTGADGTVLANGLQPGTYYAKELPSGSDYWVCDTSVKTVTVAVNQTAAVTFQNTHYGRIQFEKTTNTGEHLEGWVFRVRDAEGNTIGDYTTDATGHAVTGNLPLGKYFVLELPTDDDYWQVTLGSHDITVKAGQTVTDKWHNVEQGLAQFHKATNTGGSLEGWQITLYADAACTQEIITLTTNGQGYTGYFMDPGTYWAKETGDTLGRFEDEYWAIDSSVQKFTVEPHKDTAVQFTNTQFGKLKIVKKMATDGPLAGWQFKVTGPDGNEVEGSPFTSTDSGEILAGKLLPGKYTIEEILPEGSLYYCKSENPQTIEVKPGETAVVSFTNALRPGKITVHKVDSRGEPLAGATFRLEWSQDGETWEPVHFSEKEDVALGGCTSPGLESGCLTSGEDGILEWANLYPGIQYRVTETEAPKGYVLLTKPAYQGTLSVEKLEVSLRVVNGHGFTLPETGSSAMPLLVVLQCAALAVFGATLITLRRKRV